MVSEPELELEPEPLAPAYFDGGGARLSERSEREPVLAKGKPEPVFKKSGPKPVLCLIGAGSGAVANPPKPWWC